jgi:parallel beta-helix repeat protein
MKTSLPNKVSGTSKTKSKTLSRFMMTSALVAVGVVSFSTHAQADNSWVGLAAVTGTFGTATPNVNTTNINVTTPNGIATAIGNPDIAFGDTVTVNANIFAVKDNRPAVITSILGSLKSAGTVIVIDDNGVYHGINSTIDVAKYVASTGETDFNSLQAGNTILNFTNFGTGEIVNDGIINVVDSGLVAFVASTVKNNGVINANLGRVSLAAGNETATVDLYGDGLVELAYTDKDENLLAENAGEINAVGGKIQMTAAQAKNTVDSVVNMTGIAKANSAVVLNGKIILSAKKVKVGAAATAKGNTDIKAKSVDLATTIDGVVTGEAKEVNVLSDAAKIAQGLNIVEANGTVNVAAGTYNEHLIVNKLGVALKGANAGISGSGVRGAETIVIPNSPGVTVSSNDVTIDGLLFMGAAGLDGYGIYVNGASGVTLKNNIIKDTSQHGIYALNSDNLSVFNNNIGATGLANNVKGDGINLDNSNGAVIRNNTIANIESVIAESGSGVYAKGSDNVRISNNDISNTGWDGVKVQDGDNYIVRGNTITNTGRAGVAASYTTNSKIKNNTMTDLDRWGVWSTHNQGLKIKGNSIDGVTKAHGIFSDWDTNTKIKNNIVLNIKRDGIHVQNTLGTMLIKGNEVGSTGGAENILGDGIHLINADGAVVTENTIANIKSVADEIGSGVYAQESDNITITNNTIYNTGWDGVKVRAGDNFYVANNTIHDTKRAGVAISESTNSTVEDNTMYNLRIWGIWSSLNDNADILGNDIANIYQRHGILSYLDNETLIDGNTIKNVKRNGIHVIDSGLTTISNNNIGATGGAENIQGDGVYIQNSDGTIVTTNTIANIKSVADEIGSGVYAQESDNVTISNNTIYNTGWDGVKVRAGDNYIVSDNTITNTGRAGVAASYTTNSKIENNTMTDLERWGVWSIHNQNLDILDNSINGVAKAHGIFSDWDTSVEIKDNTILNIKRNGIHVQKTVASAIIQGNKVGSTGGAENILGDGIHLINADGAVVTENTIANIKSVADEIGSGVYAQESDNITITNNTIYNTGWDGVKVRAGDNFYVANNTIHDTKRAGVAISESTNSTVEDNTMYNLRKWGIWSSLNNDTDLLGNDIEFVYQRHGILSYLDNNITIDSNTIDTVARDGIRVQDGSGIVNITNNSVTNAGWNGVYVLNYSGSSLIISLKTLEESSPSILSGLYINHNTISNSGDNGIYVDGATGYVEIKSNNITDSGNNGIYVVNYSPSYFDYPVFALVSEEDTVVPELMDGLYINLNEISNSGSVMETEYAKGYSNGNGIEVLNASGYVEIADNDIYNSGLNGIYVHDYNYQYSRNKVPYLSFGSNLELLIDGNYITDSGSNGVYLRGLNGDITVSDNEIYNSDNNGILVENVNQSYDDMYSLGKVSLLEESEEPDIYPIYPVYPNNQLIISGNDIDNSGYDGVSINQTGGYVSVDNNTITDSGENGIYVYNSSLYYDVIDGGDEMMELQFVMDYPSGYNNPIELHIVDNTVENVGFVPYQDGESKVAEEAPNGFAAINLNISGDGYAEISGNTLGNNFEYGLYARSGEIDLTGATNIIQNTDIGMGFYPDSYKGAPDEDSEEYFDFLASQLKLTNDTIGTTAFVDQSEFFVDLGYGAFYAPGTPTLLNGNDATYTLGGSTISPSSNGGFVTQAEYDVLEERFNHFNDFQNRGLFFFNIFPETQTFDQEDVFRTFNFPNEFGQGGSLIVTGLPRIAGVAVPPVVGGFNPNAIEPAAGEDETTGEENVAAIEPSAGGGASNSACWADATQALGQGTPVSFDFGGGSSSLLQDAAKCGSGTNDQNL